MYARYLDHEARHGYRVISIYMKEDKTLGWRTAGAAASYYDGYNDENLLLPPLIIKPRVLSEERLKSELKRVWNETAMLLPKIK